MPMFKTLELYPKAAERTWPVGHFLNKRPVPSRGAVVHPSRCAIFCLAASRALRI